MTKRKIKKNIIFDFDGVIINSHKIKTLAFYNIFKMYGKQKAILAKNYHLKNIGKSRFFKFKFILKHIVRKKFKKSDLSILDDKFDYFVNKRIKKLQPSKFLNKFLKKNYQKHNLYISTGTPQKKILKILEYKKLKKYFKKIYGSPENKLFHIQQIKKNNLTTLFIGDSTQDLNSAKKSKIKFLLKTNSENLSIQKIKNIKKINSFKFLDRIINSM